ncbi:hypothetical protein [Pseudorhodobacter ferrugineus]|uniref:hypothetical protein n=1 Tax=Pseudorhodobacter ferrugineus TaxID=77008 RepID=UPI000B22855E|nr:hypothetical protein [Pseudorhodobacter ferrugineus]
MPDIPEQNLIKSLIFSPAYDFIALLARNNTSGLCALFRTLAKNQLLGESRLPTFPWLLCLLPLFQK